MTEETLPQETEVQETTPDTGSESEELESLFDEPKDKSLEERLERMEKGLNKFFSEKGREKKEEPKAEEPKKTTTQSNDDLLELFFENKPRAELVKDKLVEVAEKYYGGSIIKAWKEESYLREKADSLFEANKAKSKIQSPSNQIEGEIDFKTIKAEQISKLSDKDYARYQDFMRNQSKTPGRIVLS